MRIKHSAIAQMQTKGRPNIPSLRYLADTRLINAAGWDAGTRNMRDQGRTEWNEDDWNVAAKTAQRLWEIYANEE